MGLDGASRKFLARPVVRVCDHCARVQDGSVGGASEAQWADLATYMTDRGLSHGEVWWFHTTCLTCEQSICL